VLSFSEKGEDVLLFLLSFGAVAGFVKDKVTGGPLPYANVMVAGTGKGAVTDTNGHYKVEGIPSGEYVITGIMIGYASVSRIRVYIADRKVTEIDFYLPPKPIQLKGIKINGGYFNKDMDAAASTQEMGFYEVRTDPEGYNVFRMLTGLPGVSTGTDYASQIVVRGGDPDENLTVIDNIPFPYLSHFSLIGYEGGGITLINTDLIRSLSFYRGGFPAKYGNRLSSVLDLAMRDGRQGFHTDFDLSMAGVSFSAEGGNKKGNFIISGRRSYLDVLDKVSDIGTEIPFYWDTYIKSKYSLSKSTDISGIYIYGNDTLASGDGNFHWLSSEDGGGMNIRAAGKNKVLFVTPFGDRNWWNLSDATGFLLDMDRNEYGINIKYAIVGEDRNAEFGGGIRKESIKFRLVNPSDTMPTGFIREGVDTSGNIGDIFPSLYFHVNNPLFGTNIKAGIRLDETNRDRKILISPRMSAVKDFTPKINMYFSTGIYYQYPDLFDVYFNNDLKPKKAVHLIAGINYLIRKDNRINIEIWKKYLWDMPYQSDTVRGKESIGEGNYYGIDFLLEKKLTHYLYYRGSYSFSFAYKKTPEGVYFSDWDQRHLATIVCGIKIGKMDFSTKFRYQSGRPYTPYSEDQRYQIGTHWCAPKGDINSARYTPYFRFDFQWSAHYKLGIFSITSYFNLQNITNHRNLSNMYWDTDNGVMKYNEGFKFMPVGGLVAEF